MTNKTRKTATKSQQNGKQSEGTMVKRGEYDRLKRKAINFEKKNNRFVLVIPCDGNKGWYEMGEKSALFYKYEVCDKIGVDASIKDDYDRFYDQFEIGRIRLKDMDSVRSRLKRAGMYKNESARGKSMIFELTKKYTDEEIDALREEEIKRQNALNEIIKIKLADPVLLTNMVEVSGRLHGACQHKMDTISRNTNGVRIVGLCDELIRTYYQMSDTDDTSPEAVLEMWKKLRGCVTRLLIELQIVVGLKIWKRRQCIGLAELLDGMKQRIDTHIRKIIERKQTCTEKKK